MAINFPASPSTNGTHTENAITWIFNGTSWDAQDVPVTAASIGLGSVDNTSDASKPVSTATQAALDDKQGATEGSYNSDLEAAQGGLSLGDTYTSNGVLRVLEKSLTDDAFFWLLGDEASGNAIDSSDNSRDFVAQNAPTTTTTGGFTGRSLDGVDQHFRLSSNIPNTSASWHIAAHVYVDSLSVDRPVMCQGTSTGNDRAFFFRVESTGALTIHVSSDGTNTAQTVVTSPSGLIGTGGWHYVEAYHDATNSEVGVAVDGGLWTFAAHTGGIFQPVTQDDIEVGIQRFTNVLDFDGAIRHVGMWNRRLTPEERQYLYNTGTPKPWDFTT